MRIRATTIAIAVGLTLTACGGGGGNNTEATGNTGDVETAEGAAEGGDGESTEATSSGELETTELTVGAIPIADTAPLHYAVAEGMFEEVGLDVTIRESQGGAAGIPSLVSGEVDLDIGNYISLLQARESGVEVVSYPYILEHPQDAVVLASAADSPYQTAADLEGEQVSIAINTLGNLGEVLVRNAWDDAGLDWDDVEVVQIAFPEMVPAMERGDVDLAWLPEPFLTIAKGNDANIVIDTVGDEPPLEGSLISGPVLATEEFSAANPATMRAFFEVLDRAGAALNEDRAAAEATIAGYTGLPPEIVANLALPTYAPEPSEDRLQAFVDLAAGYGIVPEADVAEFFVLPN